MTPRPLDLVLNAIYKQIPKEFKHRDTIRISFEDIKSSVPYTAPEAMYLRWNQAANVLMQYIPEPESEWQKTIAKLFSAELDYVEYS